MRIVIVGDGKIGSALAEQLSREGHEITIVDRSGTPLQRTVEDLDILSIEGNGATYATQMEAGVDEAELVIAVTAQDELNLLCCLIAKKIGAKHTIARVRNPEYAEELPLISDDLGLSLSVNPELICATEMARTLRTPSAIKTDTFFGGKVELLKFQLPADSPLAGRTLMELPGIGENLPALIPAAVDAVIEVASGLVSNIDKVIIAAGQLIGGLAQGLIEAIPRLVYRLPEIISAIAAGLLKGLASIGMVGQQLVEGLWNGIKNAGRWLYDKLSGWVSDILGWIKGFLGIHSPSKVFADEVGQFIPPGITLGVEQSMPRAMRDMGEELSALATLPLPSGGTTTNMGGVVINVYGAEGQDVNALADVVMYRLQSAVERKEAVFA